MLLCMWKCCAKAPRIQRYYSKIWSKYDDIQTDTLSRLIMRVTVQRIFTSRAERDHIFTAICNLEFMSSKILRIDMHHIQKKYSQKWTAVISNTTLKILHCKGKPCIQHLMKKNKSLDRSIKVSFKSSEKPVLALWWCIFQLIQEGLYIVFFAEEKRECS